MSSKDLIIDNIISELKECCIIKNPDRREGTHWHTFESIKSFHGINVCIRLIFYFTNMDIGEMGQYHVHLAIIHSQIDTYDELFQCRIQEPSNISSLYNREVLSDTLDKFKEKLLTLHFSKFSGTFIKTLPKMQIESGFFEDIPAIIFKGEKCSICFDITDTTTKCNHYLCIPCFQEIKLISLDEDDEIDEDGENLIRRCPICREDIFYTTA
jgi:hypothetical protein